MMPRKSQLLSGASASKASLCRRHRKAGAEKRQQQSLQENVDSMRDMTGRHSPADMTDIATMDWFAQVSRSEYAAMLGISPTSTQHPCLGAVPSLI